MDDLTEAQTDELVGRLRDLQAELEQQLANASDRTDTVDLDQPIGRLSRMDALQQQAMAKEQLRRTRLRLSQVKQALVAADEDEYGVCRSCEEPIAYRRLNAFPEAPFCIGCRSAIEQR